MKSRWSFPSDLQLVGVSLKATKVNTLLRRPCPEQAGEEMDRKCNPEAGCSEPPLLCTKVKSGAREHFFSPCPRLGRPALGPQASQHMVSVKSAKSRLRKDVSRQGFGSSVRALAGNVVTSSARTTSSTAGCGGLCSKGAAACR